MCECYRVGGKFIAEDPDCPVHGADAQREAEIASQEKQNLEDRVGELEANVAYLLKVVSSLTT